MSEIFDPQPFVKNGKPTFFAHVFSTTDESKAEILNVMQYAILGIIPIYLLNKMIGQWIPESSDEKSSVELMIEIVLQMALMFIGILLIHRVIVYIPTYSEYKYDALSLTSTILAFFVIILCVPTKLSMKANILYDRAMDLWNGTTMNDLPQKQKKRVSFHGNETTSSNVPTNIVSGPTVSTIHPETHRPGPASSGIRK